MQPESHKEVTHVHVFNNHHPEFYFKKVAVTRTGYVVLSSKGLYLGLYFKTPLR